MARDALHRDDRLIAKPGILNPELRRNAVQGRQQGGALIWVLGFEDLVPRSEAMRPCKLIRDAGLHGAPGHRFADADKVVALDLAGTASDSRRLPAFAHAQPHRRGPENLQVELSGSRYLTARE